jgi:hypothetical protein
LGRDAGFHQDTSRQGTAPGHQGVAHAHRLAAAPEDEAEQGGGPLPPGLLLAGGVILGHGSVPTASCWTRRASWREVVVAAASSSFPTATRKTTPLPSSSATNSRRCNVGSDSGTDGREERRAAARDGGGGSRDLQFGHDSSPSSTAMGAAGGGRGREPRAA